MSYIGSNKINEIYVESTKIKEVYLGNTKIKLLDLLESGTIPYELNQQDISTKAIYVNQSGYNLDSPKIATVTNVPNSTAFYIKKTSDNSIVYSGRIQNQKANFSDFYPTKKESFYLECSKIKSYNFFIGKYWLERVLTNPTLRFMDGSRQDTFDIGGNTGYGWRDSHQFSFELNSLVQMYMANPSAYERMPYGISNLSTCEYPELRVQNEPDIIWLMKFGAMRYYDLKVNHGYSLHALIKGQLAYFLFIYPHIKQYVSESFYNQIRDFTIQEWSNPSCTLSWYDITELNNSLFLTQDKIGTIKGQLPPAYAVIPNLMMYEVAKRDSLGNEQTFFDSAYNNCKWVIDFVNLDDPTNTKGQRMSEHITMEALCYFQELYPTQAPTGLLNKINRWVDVMIARSNNMWDLRKYADKNDETGFNIDQWTGGGETYNEPGNLAGFMASAYASKRVISDTAKKNRLTEIAFAQMDAVFGRNPFGRHFSYNAVRDIEGVDLGWFEQVDGLGHLINVTGVLDGAPKESAYPYDPIANYGYTEGWIAFNTAWNASLAYCCSDETELKVFNSTFTSEISTVSVGSALGIKLKAPLNFDETKMETGEILIKLSDGTSNNISVTESSLDDYYFTTNFTVPSNITYIDISYGFGLFNKTVRINVV